MSLRITYVDPTRLKPSPGNARTHSKQQLEQLARSIRSFGFNNPILLDAEGHIVAGHGRALAAIQIGMTSVPSVELAHLTDAQRRAYVIADNKLAELAGWDRELLGIELQTLVTCDLDFELTDIGFETAEIDLLIGQGADGGASEPEPNVPVAGQLESVARRGDIWLLGKHRLFCGDALDAASYQAVMGTERASMMFTDPPYNVPVQGHVSGLGKARHAEFCMASGDLSSGEFTAFLGKAISLAAAASINGAIHFVCMDWRHLGELQAAASTSYSEMKNLCVWVKTNGGMGSLYRSQHELVGVFKVGKAKHVNNVELGRHGRSRTNVWTYPGMNSFQEGRDAALALHPTVKPTNLIADAIYDCSARDGIILDPFGGSGSTILAAERTGRRARVIELDPAYVDVTLYRYGLETGNRSVNASNGSEYKMPPTRPASPRSTKKREGQK